MNSMIRESGKEKVVIMLTSGDEDKSEITKRCQILMRFNDYGIL